MTIETELAEMARKIAEELRNGAAKLEQELIELENQRSTVQAKLDAAEASVERLEAYQPSRDSNYFCPRCWLIPEEPISAGLSPINGTDNEDRFSCINCKHGYTFAVD